MDKTTALRGQPKRVLAERYVLQGLLGQGGMADVELAHDQKLGRQVAVKMLHTRYVSDPSFLQRFRREALAAASLNHPNVVGVYDTGDSDGRPFIVMEYVAGRSLRDVLSTEELLPQRAAEIAGEAALALHYAHGRGLVHRDVKPANIMISDERRVKVTDFGIARAMNAQTMTQTAMTFGTAAYVSPEQAQGEQVDPRSDIYSLGVVLYEMLTGRPPFTGDSAVALAYKHVSSEPIPPARLNPEVSPQLDAVVRKAMAKHPADRYQTARAFHDDLRRAVAGMRVSAPPPAAQAVTQVLRGGGDRTLVAPAYTPPTDSRRGQRYEAPPQRKGSLGWVIPAVLIVALFAAAGYFIVDLTRRDPIQLVAVPKVTGLKIQQAQALLEAEGFRFGIGDFEASKSPANTVIRTEPTEGERAQKGSTVTIIPSSGPINVPSVFGKTSDEARAAIEGAGLAVAADERREGSNTVEKDRVIRTDPAEGSPLGPRDQVTLITSNGPSSFEMPDVTDRTEADARDRILGKCPTDNCVRITTVRDYSDTIEPDRVIRTKPAAGEQAPIRGTVTIVVSDGPQPIETPTETPTETPSDRPPTDSPSSKGKNKSSKDGGLVGELLRPP
ncbi:MAG: Stk1 family PASTA domain-containing Ser/Thr kinase [Egibacteraceae bacterium]